MAIENEILETAKALVAEHGAQGARAHAVNAIHDLYARNDLYGVSIWRQVRKAIADITNEAAARAQRRPQPILGRPTRS